MLHLFLNYIECYLKMPEYAYSSVWCFDVVLYIRPITRVVCIFFIKNIHDDWRLCYSDVRVDDWRRGKSWHKKLRLLLYQIANSASIDVSLLASLAGCRIGCSKAAFLHSAHCRVRLWRVVDDGHESPVVLFTVLAF